MTDKRRSARKPFLKPAKVLERDGALMATCMVVDLSDHGAQLKFAGPVPTLDEMQLRLGTDQPRPVRVVRRSRDRLAVEFESGD